MQVSIQIDRNADGDDSEKRLTVFISTIESFAIMLDVNGITYYVSRDDLKMFSAALLAALGEDVPKQVYRGR